MPKTTLFAASLIIALTAASPALGQPPSEQAEVLFKEGREALASGDYDTACGKFASSYELSGAVGPLVNLADCEERRGRLATAQKRWREAVDKLRDKPKDPRAELAGRRVAVLEERAPRLTITVGEGAPADTTLRLDEQDLGKERRVEVVLDPGDHRIVVRASGHEEKSILVKLIAGDKKEIVADLGRSFEAGKGGEGGPSSRRIAGLVVGGVGALGLVAGGVTGALMLSKKSIVDDHCNSDSRGCDFEGAEAAEAGRKLGVVNAVLFGVGAAAVGVGVVLILTGGGEEKATTSVGVRALPAGAGISLGRTF